MNILQGLELHENVLNAEEQEKLVNRINTLQEQGQAGKLMREYTPISPGIGLPTWCCVLLKEDREE